MALSPEITLLISVTVNVLSVAVAAFGIISANRRATHEATLTTATRLTALETKVERIEIDLRDVAKLMPKREGDKPPHYVPT